MHLLTLCQTVCWLYALWCVHALVWYHERWCGFFSVQDPRSLRDCHNKQFTISVWCFFPADFLKRTSSFGCRSVSGPRDFLLLWSKLLRRWCGRGPSGRLVERVSFRACRDFYQTACMTNYMCRDGLKWEDLKYWLHCTVTDDYLKLLHLFVLCCTQILDLLSLLLVCGLISNKHSIWLTWSSLVVCVMSFYLSSCGGRVDCWLAERCLLSPRCFCSHRNHSEGTQQW